MVVAGKVPALGVGRRNDRAALDVPVLHVGNAATRRVVVERTNEGVTAAKAQINTHGHIHIHTFSSGVRIADSLYRVVRCNRVRHDGARALHNRCPR